MIKILDKKYEKKVIEYLNLEKEINTFNLQEIQNYGFENVFYKIYSDIDEFGNIKGILFKCFEYLTFYAYKDFDVDGFCGGFNLQNCWSTAYVAANAIV